MTCPFQVQWLDWGNFDPKWTWNGHVDEMFDFHPKTPVGPEVCPWHAATPFLGAREWWPASDGPQGLSGLASRLGSSLPFLSLDVEDALRGFLRILDRTRHFDSFWSSIPSCENLCDSATGDYMPPHGRFCRVWSFLSKFYTLRHQRHGSTTWPSKMGIEKWQFMEVPHLCPFMS